MEAREYYLQRARDVQALATQADGDRKALYSSLAEQWAMMAASVDSLPGSLGALRAKDKQPVAASFPA
jgi:hypothetical protein